MNCNKSIYTILVALLLFACDLSSQTSKDIHLMHGLGGDVSSWELAATGLEDNCSSANVTNGSYASADGIQAYLDDFIPNVQAVGSTDDIAIAHSFGTIAARSLGINNYFGGYISVAGPHAGAEITASVLNGKVDFFIGDACQNIVRRPARKVATILSFGLSPSLPVEFLLDNMDEYFCDNLFGLLLSIEGICLPGTGLCIPEIPYVGQDMQSIKELQPGDLASQLPSAAIPAIAIRSDLESPEHWNLLGITDLMTGVSATYRDVASYARAVASVFKPRLWNPLSWNPASAIRTTNLNRAANRFDDGADWIDNSVYGWHDIIGADNGGRWVTIDSWVPFDEVPCFLNYDCPPKWWCVLDDCVPWLESRCGPAGPNSVPEVNIMQDIWVPNPPKPSDGVVLTENQSLPGALRTIDVDNVSHFGQRLDTRVGGVLDRVDDQFDFSDLANPVFRIDNCNILN